MQPPDFERSIHRALTALPFPAAPRTLLPRVLDAVRLQMMRPWYERPWFTWPVAWRTAVVALWAVLGTALAALWVWADGVIATRIGPGLAGIPLTEVGALLAAVEVTRRAVVEPVLVYAVAAMVLVCMICAAAGAALTRMTLGGTQGWE